MDAVRSLSGLNLNFLGLVTTRVTAGAAATFAIAVVATGGALTVARNGIKAILAAGIGIAFVKYNANGVADTSVQTLVSTATTGQACIMLSALKNVGGSDAAAGTETLVQVLGPAVDLDINGTIKQGIMKFPVISDDALIPVAYTVVSFAANNAGTFTFGTSNWNAAGITVSNANDIAALPRRPMATTIANLGNH